MNTIVGLKKIAAYLKEDDVLKLNEGANYFKRYSNIHFKVFKANEAEITIGVRQEYNLAENYLRQKELIALTKELFSKFLPSQKIYVHATPFTDNYISKIDCKWVQKEMLERHIKVKEIVQDTGVERSNISAWVNGQMPMSQVVKAMFFFYFQSK